MGGVTGLLTHIGVDSHVRHVREATMLLFCQVQYVEKATESLLNMKICNDHDGV